MTDTQRLALLNAGIADLKQTVIGFTEFAKVGHPPSGKWESGLATLDQLAADLTPAQSPPPVPALGPVFNGGKAILDQDLTHPTDGVPGFPAFDDGVGHPGLAVIAPETISVTKIGRFRRRDGKPDGKSVYATGASKIKYVFGHLENVPSVGSKIGKGGTIATISPNHEAPHVHVGIDASPLTGKELEHHLNYTHGAPLVGVQLTAALT